MARLVFFLVVVAAMVSAACASTSLSSSQQSQSSQQNNQLLPTFILLSRYLDLDPMTTFALLSSMRSGSSNFLLPFFLFRSMT